MSHLLDTDVCISILRGSEPRARERLRALREVAVSTITIAELAYGAARSRAPEENRVEVERLTRAVDVLDIDAPAAWHAGQIRAELARLGTPIGGYDLLIAGVARSRDLMLVTANDRECERVPDLRIEAW
ncbi:type II toxin-antitoxin system VapC family toxin [Nocardioides stalactiti]|uniref:type II toxin-antitoxin system VapC family toxin n=1 Tax=Nocardioides stalactiti TaxID=2755356 RepID=UPI001C7F7460|nr:type II toxin-antitoxin system VapC family toxin [Nocardioides stalactiti]